jgi:hypothetical protein
MLLAGFADKATTAKGEDPASVAAHVRVSSKGGINPGHEGGEGVGAKVEEEVFGPVKVLEEAAELLLILFSGLLDPATEERESKEDVRAGACADIEELGDGAVERVGTFAAKGRGIGVDSVEVIRAWCGGGTGDGKAAVIDGFLDVGWHVDGGGAVAMVGDVHAEEVVAGATGDGHFTEFGLKEGKDFVDDGGFLV